MGFRPYEELLVINKNDKKHRYNFSYFKEKDKQAILDFIEEYPLAFMTGSFAWGNQVANQVAVLLEQRNGELYFQGHIMRNTDHHKALIAEVCNFSKKNNFEDASVEAESDNIDVVNFYRMTKFTTEMNAIHFTYNLTMSPILQKTKNH